jgi:hypothetical protein
MFLVARCSLTHGLLYCIFEACSVHQSWVDPLALCPFVLLCCPTAVPSMARCLNTFRLPGATCICRSV